MSTDVISALAQNGPWAVVAGFLLHTVIKAWTEDKKQTMMLITEFKDSMVALRSAVEDMRSAVEDMNQFLGKELSRK